MFQWPSGLRKNLVFVHLPKTGGTSARDAIAPLTARRQLLKDYGPRSRDTSPAFRAVLSDPLAVRDLERHLDRRRGTFVIGHFAARKYRRHFPIEDFATILRDPFARLVSEFNHYRRHKGLQGEFRAFLAEQRFANVMSRALDGVDIDRFGFLALTETMDRDFPRFGAFLGAGIEPIRSNKGVYDAVTGTLSADAELRDLARRHHTDDFALYDYVAARLAGKTAPQPRRVRASAAGLWGGVTIDGKASLVGWIGCGGAETPHRRVRIFADGAEVTDVEVNETRRDLYYDLTSELPRCGFRIRRGQFREIVPEGAKELRVVDLDTGIELAGSPVRLTAEAEPADAISQG